LLFSTDLLVQMLGERSPSIGSCTSFLDPCLQAQVLLGDGNLGRISELKIGVHAWQTYSESRTRFRPKFLR
jgi:hypothetical protein